MEPVHHSLVRFVSAVFALGCAGCLVAIPIIACKFAAVLFEKDEEMPEEEGATAVPDKPTSESSRARAASASGH